MCNNDDYKNFAHPLFIRDEEKKEKEIWRTILVQKKTRENKQSYVLKNASKCIEQPRKR